MERDEAFKKALKSAYDILARRPHASRELEKKLADKGVDAETVKGVLQVLFEKKFLDDEDVALRWAQFRIRDRHWGKAKVAAFLREKGIDGAIVDRVQDTVWAEFSEPDIARKAVAKRFPDGTSLPRTKVLSFLRSRGFSSGVIYELVNGISEAPGADEE